MTQSQEELQRRMASLVAELRGVLTQINTGPSNATPASASVTGGTTVETGSADVVTAAAADPSSAFPSSVFSVTSGSRSDPPVNATLDQDIARLFSSTNSADGAPATAGVSGNVGDAGDMEQWMMNMFGADYSGGQGAPSMQEMMLMMQQWQAAQQAYGGRGASRFSFNRRGGRGYSVGRGGAAFPPSGAHFVNHGYNADGYGNYPEDDMMAMMFSMWEHMQQMQQQRPQSNAVAPQQPAASVSGGSGSTVAPATSAAKFPPPQPAPAKAPAQSPNSTGPPSTFRPNLAAKPFKPPNAPPLYGSPITQDNVAVMKKAFGGQDEEIHYATGAAAPRKRVVPPTILQHDDNEDTVPMGFVEFKRQKVRKYPISGNSVIQPGQYVMVDGDRGLDCGLLVLMTAPNPEGGYNVVALEGFQLEDPKMKKEKGRIVRVAENHEVDKLHNEVAQAEKTALRACRQRCADGGLKIEILDCEYQFDMKKVSFYFNSDKSVDFRVLVRELYRSFGARIWMENINPNVKNVVPHGPRHHH